METGSGHWCDLLDELLEEILLHLPLSNHLNFSLVCKSWHKVTAAVYPADDLPLLVHFKKRWYDNYIHYYSPSTNKTFKVESTLDLRGARVYFSKDGWLLFYRLFEVILVHPFANISISFPGLLRANSFDSIAFAGPPLDKTYFVIFAITSFNESRIEISTWDCEGWEENFEYDNNFPFNLATDSCPVILRTLVYCLGAVGNIGVYDIETDEWKILQEPKKFPYEVDECYLSAWKGKLIATTVRRDDPRVEVLRLNQTTMQWEKIDFLKSNIVLFSGTRTSLLKNSISKRMRNTIHLSRFSGVPETVNAKIKRSDDRYFFVPEFDKSFGKSDDGKFSNGEKMLKVPLKGDGKFDYCGSLEYPSSIWYEPRIPDNSPVQTT